MIIVQPASREAPRSSIDPLRLTALRLQRVIAALRADVGAQRRININQRQVIGTFITSVRDLHQKVGTQRQKIAALGQTIHRNGMNINGLKRTIASHKLSISLETNRNEGLEEDLEITTAKLTEGRQAQNDMEVIRKVWP